MERLVDEDADKHEQIARDADRVKYVQLTRPALLAIDRLLTRPLVTLDTTCKDSAACDKTSPTTDPCMPMTQLICRPFDDRLPHAIHSYMQLKKTNPQMSACIIMTDTAAVAHVDLLDTMTLLHEFAEGESIFISPSLTDQTPDPTPCPIKVFYDPPCTKQCLGVGIDIAEFDAVVNGARTTAAMDSAASDCFVTASAVHRIGLIQNPCPIFKVQVANGPPVMIRTVCTLQVRIQDHKSVVRAYVLPDGLSTVDLLLGRTWLGEYRANLDFSPKHVWARLHTRGGKQTVVKSRSRASRDCSPHDVVAYAAREDL